MPLAGELDTGGNKEELVALRKETTAFTVV
jgi:hypothetical protein